MKDREFWVRAISDLSKIEKELEWSRLEFAKHITRQHKGTLVSACDTCCGGILGLRGLERDVEGIKNMMEFVDRIGM